MDKIKTLKTSELSLNSSKVINLSDKQIALFNYGGEYYALDDMCSHAEASLSEGDVYDCKVECPLHGAEFDLKTGDAVTLPATKPVNKYKVNVEDGYIFLEMKQDA
jgi:3-phenylpropionate/trans-cinnamate dioxygenase ferredoxin subunit|tara:strand:+ start:1062 stop:1379 length:318 start_codon:yes stop_codon:yes gene_type:complete